MRTLLAVILALFLPAAALADPAGGNQVIVNRYSGADTGINGSLLSSNPSFMLRSSGLTTWTIYATLTRAAATDLRMTCTGGPRTTLPQRPIPVSTPTSDGNITNKVAQFGWYGLTGGGMYGFVVSPVLDDYFACTFSGTGATSDTLIVEARGQLP